MWQIHLDNNYLKRCETCARQNPPVPLQPREAGRNLTFPFLKIISLCWLFLLHGASSQWGCHVESTMHKAEQRCITYQSGYLSTPAVVLQPTSSPHMPRCAALPGPRAWKTQSDEGMDCAMNGSHCVIFTFPGSSPAWILVFYYYRSWTRSDKEDGLAMTWHPPLHPPSCPFNLTHLIHLSPPFLYFKQTMEVTKYIYSTATTQACTWLVLPCILEVIIVDFTGKKMYLQNQ